MPVTSFVNRRKLRAGPDPGLVRDQLLHLQNLFKVYGAEMFCEQFLWILRKNPEPGSRITLPSTAWNKRLVPFRLNKVQRDIENRKGLRNICLKYRQGGYTTYFINRRLYVAAVIDPGTGGLLISQTNSYATKHFDILRRSHRFFGAIDPFDTDANVLSKQLHENLLHTRSTNRREIILDQLDSRIVCDSAEIEQVGQGLTLQHVVCTEVARWEGQPEETLANMKEAIPVGGTLDLESTANGLGGYFCEEVMRARDSNTKNPEFTYFFHQWWWEDEYRDDIVADVKTLTEEEKELRKQFKIDLNQMTWRRNKMAELRHNFAEKYPEDEITAFLVSGKSFFDRDILRHRLMELQNFKPYQTFRGGELRLFKKRIIGRNYIIGADVASGRQVSNEDTDFCYALVIDEETGEDVAAYRARVSPEEFGFDLAELGKTYNNAHIAVERNGDGGSTILTLQVQCGYMNLYEHREWFKKDRTKQVIEVLGFPTTPKTRPIALNKVAQFIREDPELIWDIQFVKEALTFVRDEKGKPAAAEGCHDDAVSAAWVARMVRLVRLGYYDPTQAPGEKYGEEAAS